MAEAPTDLTVTPVSHGRFGYHVLVNIGGRAWSALMALAFVPVYLRLMGIEAYGLVAFFTTLQVAFTVVDASLTTTLNRELARRAVSNADPDDSRDLLRTLEIAYWATAFLAALAITAASGWLASRWFHPQSLSVAEARHAISLMAVVLAFQWPLGFYSGGLLGLDRQVTYNLLLVGSSTLRYAGAAAALAIVRPTLDVFFSWQAVVSAAFALATAAVLWSSLGRGSRRARFSIAILKSVWRFTAGLVAISATVLALVQVDKVLLSRLISLEQFGYYSLAATVAGSLYYIVTPIDAALFPRLTRSIASGDAKDVSSVYHLAAQVITVFLAPLAAMFACFAPELLGLWTRRADVAQISAPLLRLLAVGFALNGVMNTPYMLQLAHGRTRLVIQSNVVAIAILMPALIVLTPIYGAIAAAIATLVLNLLYIVVQAPIVHWRLLPGELAQWYLHDLARPAAAAVAVVLAGRVLTPAGLRDVTLALWIGTVLVASFAAAAMAAPRCRTAVRWWMASSEAEVA